MLPSVTLMNLLKALAQTSSMTLLSRILGFIRDASVAHVFGAGGLTDAYQATPKTAYLIMFIMCAGSYLFAWGVMKALVPRHKPITDL